MKDVTTKVDTDKHGVKPAVDEWLVSHPGWQLVKPVPGEPVVLVRTQAKTSEALEVQS